MSDTLPYDSPTQDFDILKSLWSSISEVCVSPPSSNEPAKECFLMETPGFSVDPGAFDPLEFDPRTMMSPECATASLCDRVPALAPYFYDTGDHISSYWKVFLETFFVQGAGENDADEKARYDKAIEMLYGSLDGYINQQKTSLYLSLDTLREEWEVAERKRADFEKMMRRDTENWPDNYHQHAGPYIDAVEEAYDKYDDLRQEIQGYKDTIFAYETEDIHAILLDQASSEELMIYLHV